MKMTLISTLLFAVFSLAMRSQVTEFGIFTETECPIRISEELASSGKCTFGFMTVPEFVLPE